MIQNLIDIQRFSHHGRVLHRNGNRERQRGRIRDFDYFSAPAISLAETIFREVYMDYSLFPANFVFMSSKSKQN